MGNPWSQLACAPELCYFIDLNIGHCNFTAKEETLISDSQQKLYFISLAYQSVGPYYWNEMNNLILVISTEEPKSDKTIVLALWKQRGFLGS